MHLAKEKGNKKKRKDKKLEVDLDIDVYIYKHTFGLCYYYENNTTNKRLRESLNIENNTNIDFVGEKEGTNEVMIIIEPGQNKEMKKLIKSYNTTFSNFDKNDHGNLIDSDEENLIPKPRINQRYYCQYCSGS